MLIFLLHCQLFLASLAELLERWDLSFIYDVEGLRKLNWTCSCDPGEVSPLSQKANSEWCWRLPGFTTRRCAWG